MLVEMDAGKLRYLYFNWYLYSKIKVWIYFFLDYDRRPQCVIVLHSCLLFLFLVLVPVAFPVVVFSSKLSLQSCPVSRQE